ncbi:CHAT domain-containing protein [Dyadobacter sp. CY351]|uniref:CHAT domain-containing protein n=1 Tax=Dyadobacter sp. CY351 TaxID=2909337 RepID=UPI001F3DCB2A|nr:CHAT domain-containing protein [Dyadobacter sp. CY351]MCF2518540.1 CHAT domain-containing protein [Dyadobacter sp. CY351]
MVDPSLEYFAALTEIEDSEHAVKYVFQHPSLLSKTRWTHFRKNYVPLSAYHKEMAINSLKMLESFFDYLLDFNNYLLGYGPIESIYQRYIEGKISISTAMNLSASERIRMDLSPIYIRRLCAYAENTSNRETKGWKSAFSLLDIIENSLSSIHSEYPFQDEWKEMWSFVIIARLGVACNALYDVPDNRILEKSVALANDSIQLHKIKDDLKGEIIHRLGVLYLDPWFMGKTSSNYESQESYWAKKLYDSLNNSVMNFIDGNISLPKAKDALQISIKYLEHARLMRKGVEKAYTLKALGQAHMWINVINKTEKFEISLELYKEALSLFTPKSLYVNERNSLESSIAFCSNSSEIFPEDNFRELADRLLGDSEETLIKDHDLISLIHMLSQGLTYLTKKDPNNAVKLFSKSENIIFRYGSEENLFSIYNHGVKLMRKLLVPQTVISEQRTRTKQRYADLKILLNNASISKPGIYTEMILTAFESSEHSEEEDGILILKEIGDHIFIYNELRPFYRLYDFMLSNLLLNCGATYVHEGNFEKAIEHYFLAIASFARLGFPHLVNNILKRVEDLLLQGDYDLGKSALSYFSLYSILIEGLNESFLSESCQSIYKILLTKFLSRGSGNPTYLTYLCQLAKGYAYNSVLQNSKNGRVLQSDLIKDKIVKINALSELLKTTSVNYNHFLDSETLLMSYAGYPNTLDGTDPYIEIRNLKVQLDKQISTKVVSDRIMDKDNLLASEDVQALLTPQTVLLCQLAYPTPDGHSALHNLIYTTDEVHFITGKLNEPSWIVQMSQGDKIEHLPFFGPFIASIREQIQEDPETQGLSREAEQSLLSMVDIFLPPPLRALLSELQKKGKTHLCIWPHGPFHYLPFHLLPYNKSPLCHFWNISYIPNLGVLARQKIGASFSNIVKNELTVMGISYMHASAFGNLPHLQSSIDEATEIAKLFGISPIIENKVTEQTFIFSMSTSKWVHLSAHGLFDADAPCFQCLLLSPDALDDGVLNAYELVDQNFANVEVLTLSACETALGRFDYSDNLRGLPAILLQTGVKTIIGTLWEVEQESSRHFFTGFYSQLKRGSGKLESFHLAQLETQKIYPDYRDWGAFYFTGEF